MYSHEFGGFLSTRERVIETDDELLYTFILRIAGSKKKGNRSMWLNQPPPKRVSLARVRPWQLRKPGTLGFNLP